MCWKVELGGVIIVDDEVDYPHDIEGDNEQPEERTYPHGEKRHHSQKASREVAVGSECGETRGKIADDAWKDEDESEEPEAVESGNSALCFDVVHRPESWPDIYAEAQQPSEVAENEMYSEEGFWRHVMISFYVLVDRASSTSVRGPGLPSRLRGRFAASCAKSGP